MRRDQPSNLVHDVVGAELLVVVPGLVSCDYHHLPHVPQVHGDAEVLGHDDLGPPQPVATLARNGVVGLERAVAVKQRNDVRVACK